MGNTRMAKTVAEEYAELYHYTNAEGLHGIITEQYLRATNIAFLNDAEERIYYFEKRMPLVLDRAIRSVYDDQSKLPEYQERIEQKGGYEKVVTDLKNNLVTKIREVSCSINEPYVTSFCTTKDINVARDGLLSQWRAYGADGGYAIIFNTNDLEILLKEEVEKYMYLSSLLGDINYHGGKGSDELMHDEFQKSEILLRNIIENFLKSKEDKNLAEIETVINQLACLTKHCGFHEEREVRIVAIRGTETFVKRLRDGGVTQPVRSVHHHPRNGALVPYIRLFEGITSPLDKKLPIKAVIIGPHPDREKRARAVDLLLKQHGIKDAEVRFSEIPYLPR